MTIDDCQNALLHMADDHPCCKLSLLAIRNVLLDLESHHFACDCREALMAESMQTQLRVIDWRNQSDAGLRLRCGELTAQEIRTIRAVFNAILPLNT